MTGTVVLVVAKAPVPGRAKTRLTPPATPRQAAAIAAAALLDTLDAAHATGYPVVVALAGHLGGAERRDELRAALRRTTVIAQRGATFAERLGNAHADLCFDGRFDGRVVQIGMDTPQVTAELLADAAARLADSDAVLGPATDGGWWALGLRDRAAVTVAAGCLRHVPTSRDDTGARTLAALHGRGLSVGLLPELSDVDTMDDAVRVATACGQDGAGRFAPAVDAVAA